MRDVASIAGCANVNRYASSFLVPRSPRDGRRATCAPGARRAPGRDRRRAARRGGRSAGSPTQPPVAPLFDGHASLPPVGRNVVRARAALLRAGDDARLGLQPGRGGALVRRRHPRGSADAPRAAGRSRGRRARTSTRTWMRRPRPTSPPHCSARRRSRASAPPRYRGLIAALAARHPDPAAPVDEEAYAARMRALARRFPRDAEIATLAAEAELNLHPYDWWEPDGAAKPWTGDGDRPACARAAAGARPSGRQPLLDPRDGELARILNARSRAPTG